MGGGSASKALTPTRTVPKYVGYYAGVMRGRRSAAGRPPQGPPTLPTIPTLPRAFLFRKTITRASSRAMAKPCLEHAPSAIVMSRIARR
jgi:hypothetical protein